MFLIVTCRSSIKQASTDQRMHIVREIANGIKFMHTRDPIIVHQDIKPLNVMVLWCACYHSLLINF